MKHTWIRVLSATMASLLLLFAFPLAAAAETAEQVQVSVSFSGASESWTEEERTRILRGAQVLEQGMLAMQESISVSSLQLSRDELKAAFQYAMDSCPELFHVDFTYNLYTSGNGYASRVDPVYRTTPEQRNNMLFEMKNVASDFFLSVSEETNDLGVALLAHDYLCTNVVYPEESDLAYHHTAYGALVNGSAVCQGYALAYMYLLDFFGIESVYVSNADHGWIKVRLDGAWYHVDPTWDDPIDDKYGYAAKQYFLLSDSEIGVDHFDYSDFLGVPADSNAYADFPLRDNVDSVAYLNGYFFFPYNSLLAFTQTPEDPSSYHYLFNDYFYDVATVSIYNGRVWFINQTNLYSFALPADTAPSTITAVKVEADLLEHGLQMLIFDRAISMTITADGTIGITDFAKRQYVLSMQAIPPSDLYFSFGFYYTVSGEAATITDYIGNSVRLHIPSELGGIPVTAIEGGAGSNLPSLQTIIIRDHVTSIASDAFPLSENATVYGFAHSAAQTFASTRSLAFVELPANHQPGDVNMDGAINNKDATILLRHLATWNVEIDQIAADVNGDGSITNRDVTHLLRYLAAWNGIVLM